MDEGSASQTSVLEGKGMVCGREGKVTLSTSVGQVCHQHPFLRSSQ